VGYGQAGGAVSLICSISYLVQAEGAGQRPGPPPTNFTNERQRVKVCVSTVTPPCVTVMVALVKSMSVICAVQLLFGHPA
jgi:hypothetical protein